MFKKLLFLTGLSGILIASDGASLFDVKYSMCHVTNKPLHMSTLVSTPIMGVMNHVKMTYL